MKTLKKIALAAVGASLLVAPAAFAAPAHGYGGYGGYGRGGPPAVSHAPARQVQFKRWSRGQRFDYRQARNYRVLSNPHAYRLSAAPRGYRWVQSDKDAVLVGITTGLIASVIANAFH